MRGSVSITPMNILASGNREPEMSVRARRHTTRRWSRPLACDSRRLGASRRAASAWQLSLTVVALLILVAW